MIEVDAETGFLKRAGESPELLNLLYQGEFYEVPACCNYPSQREDLTKLLELLKKNKINPKIAEIIPLVEAQRAHECS